MSFRCRKCNQSLLPDSQFCPACGAVQSHVNQSTTYQSPNQPGETGKLPAGKLLCQRYHLLHTMGKGGMGAVYLAQDRQLGGRLVAVKEMSMRGLAPHDIPQAVKQFQSEAHILASLHHRSLPAIYDYFEEDRRWYLVMSFIQGQTLQSYLDTTPENKLPMKEAVRIGVELCTVLNYLHTHKPPIIFRDLKPRNVMITPAGEIYLIDFGIARHFKPEQTKDTAYYQSVGYAPPEQFGQAQTSPRSDIYSLGVTLHQMLTGHNPTSQPFHLPSLRLLDPTIPIPLVQLVGQMLELDENSRPVDVITVQQELKRLLTPPRRVQHNPQAHAATTVKDPHYQLQRSFLAHLRGYSILFWACFIALVPILGIAIAMNLRNNGYSSEDYTATQTIGGTVGIVSALVGLACLLTRGRMITKKRLRMESIGGIIFTILGNIALIGLFFSSTLLKCVPVPHQYNCELVDKGYDFSQFGVILLMTFFATLLLLLGGFLLARYSGAILGAIWGTLLVLSGIVFVAGGISTSNWQNWRIVPMGLWIVQVILGIVIITASNSRARLSDEQTHTP